MDSLQSAGSTNISITCNDEALLVAPETTIAALLTLRRVPNVSGIAIAINGSVVPRSTWATRRLTLNDEVLIITAAQGG